MRWLAWISWLTIACAGCAPAGPRPQTTPVVPPGSALLHVYLRPLPAEADALRAEVGSVAAVRADGTVHPLRLAHPALDGSAERRQSLLALGAIPAGAYVGLDVQIASARLGTGSREAALAVSGAPRRVDLAFSVAEQQAAVAQLALSRDLPVAQGYAFEPDFSAGISSATELAPSATAVASIGGTSVLAVFHKLSGEVFAMLRTEAGPRGVAYDPDRRLAYVACSAADLVESFDLSRGRREQSFPLLLGDRPTGLALTADGLTLVVANAGSNTVTILDAPGLAERSRVTVGREPVSVLIDPSGARAIVFQSGNDSLALVDLERGVPVATIVLEGGPVHGAFDPRGRLLYVIHRRSPLLAIIDLATLRVVSRPYVGGGAQAIAVDPRNGRLFLSRLGLGAIEVFDPSSLLPIQTLEMRGDASYLTIDPESEQLFAALPPAEQVLSLRLSGGTTSAGTDVGADPRWIDVAGSRRDER